MGKQQNMIATPRESHKVSTQNAQSAAQHRQRSKQIHQSLKSGK